jgi:hypothetical protein
MRKQLTILFLLFSFLASAQKYAGEFFGYGSYNKRLFADTVLHIPELNDTLAHDESIYANRAQIRVVNAELWYRSRFGYWRKVGGNTNSLTVEKDSLALAHTDSLFNAGKFILNQLDSEQNANAWFKFLQLRNLHVIQNSLDGADADMVLENDNADGDAHIKLIKAPGNLSRAYHTFQEKDSNHIWNVGLLKGTTGANMPFQIGYKTGGAINNYEATAFNLFPNGNLGLGKLNPAYNLDVLGQANFDGGALVPTASTGDSSKTVANTAWVKQRIAGFGSVDLSNYYTKPQADAQFALLSHTHTFSSLTSKPSTLAGYGITDAVQQVTGKGLSTEDYTTAEKTKLAGIATGATANSPDAFLLNLANHTGTLTASTISDFQATVSGNTDVAANTAARHTHSNITALNNVSGVNTGDETTASIKSKLGITTLSGSNTGDQDLSGLATTNNPTFTGLTSNGIIKLIGQTGTPSAPAVGTQNVYADSTGAVTFQGSNGFALSLSKNRLTANHRVYFQNKDYTLADSADVAGKIAIANYIVRESPTGTYNSSNTTFTLAHTPISGKEEVYVNGVQQELTTDYTISGATLTMIVAPRSTDKIRATYIY